MAIPYILTIYNLHLQNSRSIDMENLESHLSQLDKFVDNIDKVLENSVARGATMVKNAYSECKKCVAEIKASLTYLKALPDQQNVIDEKKKAPELLEMFSK